jgi:hypothetical protein
MEQSKNDNKTYIYIYKSEMIIGHKLNNKCKVELPLSLQMEKH